MADSMMQASTYTAERSERGALSVFEADTPPAQHKTLWLAPALIAYIVLLTTHAISPIAANLIAIILFMGGVPHGAIERTQAAVKFIMPTPAYTALYLVFGILVFSSWLISPVGTLVLFLIISAWHFAMSEPDHRAIGLWVIIGSCLIYPAQTLQIFSMLTGSEAPSADMVTGAKLLAVLCAGVMVAEYALRRLSGSPVSALRLGFVVVLFVTLPPICAVAVYFFALHGLGEFARTLAAVSRGKSGITAGDVLKLYGPATVPAMIGAVVIICLTYMGYVPMFMSAGLAVAFIIPHMLPVETLLARDRL